VDQNQSRGQHRCARPRWWSLRLELDTIGTVTVADLQRWLAPGPAYTPQPRRIVVLPR
jgi:hypothetical protein